MSTRHETDKDALSPSDEQIIAAFRGASTAEPTPGIDAAIQAAARRSVGSRPQPVGRFRWATWGVPLAAVATVVLSSTVVYWSVRDHGIENLASPEGSRYHEEAKELPHVSAQSRAEGDQTPLMRAPPAAPPSKGDLATPSVNPTQEPLRLPGASRGREAPYPSLQEPAKPKRADTLDGANVPAPMPHVSDSAIPAAAEPAASRGGAREPDVPVMSSPPMMPTVSTPPSPEMPSREQPRAELEERKKERAATLLKDSRSVSQAIGGASRAATPVDSPRKEAEVALEQRMEEIRTLIRDGATRRALDAIAALRRDHPEFKLPEDVDRFAKDNDSTSR